MFTPGTECLTVVGGLDLCNGGARVEVNRMFRCPLLGQGISHVVALDVAVAGNPVKDQLAVLLQQVVVEVEEIVVYKGMAAPVDCLDVCHIRLAVCEDNACGPEPFGGASDGVQDGQPFGIVDGGLVTYPGRYVQGPSLVWLLDIDDCPCPYPIPVK